MSLNTYGFVDDICMKSKSFDVSVSAKDKIIQVMDGNVLLASLSMTLSDNVLSLVGKNNEKVAEVKLPYSQMISDIYYDDENKEIVFIIEMNDGTISKFTINVEDLIVVYEGGHGIEITDNVISLKINDDSAKYLVSDNSGLSLKIDSLNDTFATDEEVSELLKKFATLNDLDLKQDKGDYITSSVADEIYQPKGEYATVTQLASKLDESTYVEEKSTFATKNELATKVDTIDIIDMLTKTEASSLYQLKGDYLTEIPEEYITEKELNVKGYATTTQLANKLDISTYTADKTTFALKSEMPDVSNFITNTVDNLVNYYKKNETYTKSEIDGKISAITTINFEVVLELPISGESNKIYLVPNTEQDEQNIKDEYIWVEEKWEIIGSTKVDLSNYYNKGEVDSKLKAKVDLSTYTSDKEIFVLKSEISDMATQTWVNSKGYLTKHQDISNLATKQEVTEGLAGKQDKGDYALKSELPNISGLATKEELSSKANTSDLSNYVTTVNAEATYAKKSEIPSLEGYLQTSTADEKYATKAELEGKVDDADIADMLTKSEASETYQPKGEYLTEVPSEYITETELSEKGYLTSIPEEYVTETELSGKGYATTAQLANKVDTSTYTEDKATFATKEELADKANTSDLSNYLHTSVAESTYAKKSEIPEEYTLPIATADLLGGIKVGAGLSINPGTGVLSATGGGTADSVDWANITSKPETFTPSAHNHSISEVRDLQDKLDAKADKTAIADMATKTWVGEQGYLTEHQDISQLATKQEVTEGLEAKQDKGNYITVETADGKYQVKGDYATTAQLANKVDTSTYTSDKATFALKSELTDFITVSVDNLVNYYKKSETYTKGEVDGKISAITTINFEVVGELPSSGEANKIYLVPNSEQGEQNVKDEYIWVDGKWEIIGSTKVDLSNYYNKGEVDSKLSVKVDTSTYTSDKETFALKSEISDMATQTWVTSQGYLTSHQDISNLATKQEVTEGLAGKQDKGDYALKSELPDISGFATKEELSNKADISDLNSYVTTVNAEATYAKKDEIPSLDNYLQVSVADDKYATKDELSSKADSTIIADMLTKAEASSTYQPKGNYLTEVPTEYVTDEELYAKGYATTSQLEGKLSIDEYNSDKLTFATKQELTSKANLSDLNSYVTTVNAEATYAKKDEIPDISNLATKTELENKVNVGDIADMLTKTEASSTYQPKGNYAAIEYVEDFSDEDGYIATEIAPPNAMVIARMFLHPTLNMWCHCPSYETASKGNKIITGGIKYGVAVVVGGVTCQTFPNCKYRVYYINI